MGTIKAGRVSMFLHGSGSAESLFSMLAKCGSGVNVEIAWGDIPEGASDVQLSVRLHKGFVDADCGNIHESAESRFVNNGVLNNMPIVDENCDGLDDGFSDGKMQAWAEYLGSSGPADDSVTGEEVGLCEDPEAFMPECMIEDGAPDDGEFCAASDEEEADCSC